MNPEKGMLKKNIGIFTAAAVLVLVLGILLSRSEVSAPVPEDQDSVKVIHVIDGDTVRVRFADGRESKVRLLGIDSPEMGDRRETVRIQAHLAKRFTFYHLYRKDVRLSYDWDREDDYGRILAYLWKGRDLFNEKIISEGFAFAYRRHPYKRQKEFILLEAEARRNHLGLWGEDYIEVKADGARAHLGRLAAVSFICGAVLSRRGFTFLETADRKFALLIPLSDKNRFRSVDLKALKGEELAVRGFLEDFGGQIQIVAVSPEQLIL
jgi:micrococcal nuclease